MANSSTSNLKKLRNLLSVRDLHVAAGKSQTSVLNGIDLEIKTGQIHAIMGHNGSGKSSFSRVVAGHPEYQVTAGSLEFEVNGKYIDLNTLLPEERAREGIFLSFQYPTEIPGVGNLEFLRTSFNAICKHQGSAEFDPFDFRDLAVAKSKALGIDEKFLNRDLNVDLSGGEKKRNEILQMAILNPRLAILDEIDSGLDIDALQSVGQSIKKLASPHNSIVVITHYKRLLDILNPQHVHVFSGGKIVASGGMEIAELVEAQGLAAFQSERG